MTRVLIVGGAGGTHVGQSFAAAGDALGVTTSLVDTARASAAPRLVRTICWRLLDRRPPRLRTFTRAVLAECRRFQPDHVLTTGTAPIDADTLRAIRATGAFLINFSTDDPWNSRARAGWFLEALRAYDLICTPRRANMTQLMELGSAAVRYVPFGYDPRFAYPEALTPQQYEALRSDVLFVGGGDDDRIPYIRALGLAKLSVVVYGGYWQRFNPLPATDRGLASPAVIRQATRAASICLCLVRRANRDGHVMRSFEIAATGSCMLVEDTVEHREIFGNDGDAVAYFGSLAEMTDRARTLIDQPKERARLALAAHTKIVRGNNTYEDRLRTILEFAAELRAGRVPASSGRS